MLTGPCEMNDSQCCRAELKLTSLRRARVSLVAVRIVLINLAEQVGETEHETALLVLSPGDLIFRSTLRRQVVVFNKTCNVGAPILRWNSKNTLYPFNRCSR